MYPSPSPEGLSARLAAITLETAAAPLPAEALEATRRLAQHAFGVSLAGSSLAVARIARAALGRAPGPCLVFGGRATSSADDAAFANAVAGHASLLEDSGPGGLAGGSHPGTYIFPAALAAVQDCHGSGSDLLQALGAAYECVDRLAAAIPTQVTARGFRAVPLLGPFGAAAAAGVLWRLNVEQLAAAFGIAANLAGGLNQGFVDGTMEPYLHPAFAARNGLLAARLAQAGCTASPQSLEGERGFFATFAGFVPHTPVFDRPPRSLAVCSIGTKEHATCLYNQGTLALVQRAFGPGLPAAGIERVTLRRPQRGIHGLTAPGVAAPPPYRTPLQMQMSARFTTAAALLGRAVESAQWFEQAGHDSEVSELAERLDLVPHAGPGIRIDVLMRNGKRETAEADGEPPLNFSSERCASAFEARMRPVLGERSAEAMTLLAALPTLRSLEPLTALFRNAAGENE